MSNHPTDYFSGPLSIKNSMLNAHALDDMADFLSILKSRYKDASDIGSITKILHKTKSDYPDGLYIFEEIQEEMSENWSPSWNTMCCILDEMSEDSGLRFMDFIHMLKLKAYQMDVMSSGFAGIWRSIGITDPKRKKIAVDNLVSTVSRDIHLHDGVGNKTPVLTLKSRGIKSILCSDTHITHPESDPDFLSMDDGFKVKVFHDVMDILDKSNDASDLGRSSILFSWIMPLCHRAYLQGTPASEVIQTILPIVDAFSDRVEFRSQVDKDIFCRRCFAHIAMGFPELMKEINLQKSDLIQIEMNEGIKLKYPNILESPLVSSVHNKIDVVATIYNDIASLQESGITVDIDFIMDIEATRQKASDILPAYSELDKTSLLRAIKHPEWDNIRVLRASYSSKGLPIEVVSAILKRELITYPDVRGKYSTEDQDFILKDLAKHNKVTREVIEKVNISTDILIRNRSLLPKNIKKYAFETDLGM